MACEMRVPSAQLARSLRVMDNVRTVPSTRSVSLLALVSACLAAVALSPTAIERFVCCALPASSQLPMVPARTALWVSTHPTMVRLSVSSALVAVRPTAGAPPAIIVRQDSSRMAWAPASLVARTSTLPKLVHATAIRARLVRKLLPRTLAAAFVPPANIRLTQMWVALSAHLVWCP
jgi:hypothetical protein